MSYILKEKSECQLLLLTRGESTKHAVMRVNENLRKFQLAETLINRISSDNILLGDLTAPDFFLKIVVSMPLLTSSIVRISPHPVIIRLSGRGMWRDAQVCRSYEPGPSLRHFLHIESAGLGVSASECGLDNKPGFQTMRM